MLILIVAFICPIERDLPIVTHIRTFDETMASLAQLKTLPLESVQERRFSPYIINGGYVLTCFTGEWYADNFMMYSAHVSQYLGRTSWSLVAILV